MDKSQTINDWIKKKIDSTFSRWKFVDKLHICFLRNDQTIENVLFQNEIIY